LTFVLQVLAFAALDTAAFLAASAKQRRMWILDAILNDHQENTTA